MVGITDIAESKAIELRNNEEHGLRVKVVGGGCSGFMYELEFDEASDDVIFTTDDGFQVIVDKRSFLYLSGSVVDFEGGLNGTGFKIVNPNANSTCGCGESFSL